MIMITEKYAKVILNKMSLDQKLFVKELKKVLAWLNEEDKKIIIKWVKNTHQIEY